MEQTVPRFIDNQVGAIVRETVSLISYYENTPMQYTKIFSAEKKKKKKKK